MGHYSPIVKQLRGRAKPDGMVLVVGGCATGFTPEANTSADLLYSITDASADMQLFWEAFPAEGGKARTTYMFAYADADPARPSFEKLLDTYFTLMPAYQGLPSLEAVKYKRILFGGFPCYSSTTPLAPGFDRVLQLGDASASQSPLSFGGFGSLLRHLPRLTRAISHALTDDKLSRRDLSWVHPYQPSLSAAWLFQRSMSMPVGQMQQQQQQGQQQQGPQQDAEKGGAADSSAKQQQGRRQLLPHVGAASGGGGAAAAAAVGHDAAAATAAATAAPLAAAATAGAAGGGSDNSPAAAGSGGVSSGSSSGSSASAPGWLRRLLLLPADHINALLGANFAVMAVLGQRVLKPFLQDTLQLGPLAATMLGMMLVKPLVIARVFVQVGPKVLLGWFGHFAMLTLYTLGHTLLRPLKHLSSSYSFQRLLDALQYGSSSDYRYSSAPSVAPSTASTADSSSSGSSSHSVREDHRVVDSSYGGQQAGGQQPAETGVGREEEEQQHVLVGAGGSSGRDGTGGVRTRGAVVVANNIVPGMRSGAMVHHFQQHQPPQQQQPSAA